MMLQIVNDKTDSDIILFNRRFTSTSWDDDVSIFHGRSDEFSMGRLNEAMVGLEHTLDCSLSLDNVSLKTSCKSDIIICVNEDF